VIDTSLITMPYAEISQPSLGLGILKAALIQHGISAKVCYANILFAEKIGLKTYSFLCNHTGVSLLGEWTFAGIAFPDFQPDHTKYLKHSKAPFMSDRLVWNVRNKALSFVEQLAQHILEDAPAIAGCSSTFQQHCASLAILKQIKTLNPEIVTLLGGANCEGSMGYITHQNFDWVDYVVSGEAEELLPGLCQRILENGPKIPQEELPVGVYGPSLRGTKMHEQSVSRAIVHDLDASPIPLYDDYFDTLKASPIADRLHPGLLFETSRGCWWGQKKPCAFCGLNGDGLIYRTKSPQRVVDELALLSNRYDIKQFQAADNVLDLRYFKTLLPALAQSKGKYRLLFEIRANLTREHVKQLADAGVIWVQSGIENFHDKILTLLNKGARSWQNIQLLKWSMQYGICMIWNFLINIPGESVEWYEEMMEWLPLIYHLQPPNGPIFVRYDRFSLFYKHQQQFNLQLRPFWTYSHVYPLDPDQLNDLAYYFEDHSALNAVSTKRKLETFHTFHSLIKNWKNEFYAFSKGILLREIPENRPVLSMQETDSKILIKDTRSCAVQSEIVLTGLAREIYKACDAAMTGDMIVRHMKKRNSTVTWQDIKPVIEELCAQKILLQLQDRFLSLALKEPLPKMPDITKYPGGFAQVIATKKQKKQTPHPYSISLEEAFGITISSPKKNLDT
jgi:ribosomal peptide maturation radical SAM protein 1